MQGWADLDKGHQELIRHVLHEQHKAIWEDFANHTEGGWWLDQDWSNLWERATKKAEVAILLAIHDYEDQDDEKVEN